MSYRSLAVAPLARNYLLLSRLFELSHQHYVKQGILGEQVFMSFLQEFVASIETICEENFNISLDYHVSSIEFHYYMKDNFWQQAPTLVPLFNALACLVRYGAESFRRQDYPEAYNLFLHRLALILNNESIVEAGHQEVANLLVEQLRQKPLIF